MKLFSNSILVLIIIYMWCAEKRKRQNSERKRREAILCGCPHGDHYIDCNDVLFLLDK